MYINTLKALRSPSVRNLFKLRETQHFSSFLTTEAIFFFFSPKNAFSETRMGFEGKDGISGDSQVWIRPRMTGELSHFLGGKGHGGEIDGM